MFRFVSLLPITVALVLLDPRAGVRADEATSAVRGILVRPERVSPEVLTTWKAKGATAVVVPLDEPAKQRWETVAKVVEQAGMTLWPWVEVARNPEMADAHPEWMAAIGAHHDDWRRRFPKAPTAKPGEVVKAWPWVPVGYAPAFDAHRERLKKLLGDLPGAWSGVFLSDLQAGPSSCGCGNDQCRWALDYGSAPTSIKTPGDDAAARIVAEISQRHSGKVVIPVWVTECELVDLPDAKGGTGLCGRVPCAQRDCWPRYVRNWNPLLKATAGPVALALWTEAFHRNPMRWMETALALFQTPPQGGAPLAPGKTIAVVEAWDMSEAAVNALLDRVKQLAGAWVIVLDPIDQSWEPRTVPVPRKD
jgi:hypothetical protein